MGTVSFGSFIIAVVQLIRAMLEYLEHQTKELQKKHKAVKYIMGALKSCMQCLEKCVKFTTHRAYIYTAMDGKGFCTSVKKVFKALSANGPRFAVVIFFSSFLLFLGKAVIAVGTGVVCYLWLENDLRYKVGGDKALHSTAPVMLVCLVLGYMVASAFMYVYHVAVDTILLCVCKDIDCGTPPYKMPRGIKEYVRKKDRKREKQRKRKKAARREAADND